VAGLVVFVAGLVVFVAGLVVFVAGLVVFVAGLVTDGFMFLWTKNTHPQNLRVCYNHMPESFPSPMRPSIDNRMSSIDCIITHQCGISLLKNGHYIR
jgi:hypothetical protein